MASSENPELLENVYLQQVADQAVTMTRKAAQLHFQVIDMAGEISELRKELEAARDQITTMMEANEADKQPEGDASETPVVDTPSSEA